MNAAGNKKFVLKVQIHLVNVVNMFVHSLLALERAFKNHLISAIDVKINEIIWPSGLTLACGKSLVFSKHATIYKRINNNEKML